MVKETEVTRFPARIAVADTIRYGILSAVAIISVACTAFLLIHTYGPKGIEEFDPMFVPSLVGFSLYSIYKAISLNMRTNDRNRMHFSQLIRNTVRRELTGFLSLEDVGRITTGGVAQTNGFRVWLKRDGREVLLMTDKTIGMKPLQWRV